MTKAQRWKLMREAGFTAADVAEDLGVHRTSVARVLNGASFSVRIASALAVRIGSTVEQVFPKASARALRMVAE